MRQRRQRARHAPRDGDAEERDGNLEGEADEEAGVVRSHGSSPVCASRSRCSWHANPSGASSANAGERAPPDAALLERQPDEPDRRQDGDDLRGVREVPVDRSRLRAGQRVGDGVGGEDAGGGHRGDESPREHPTRHLRDDASAFGAR